MSSSGRWRRRALSMPGVVVALTISTIGAPLWLAAAVVLDAARGRRRFPLARVGAFIWQALVLEAIALASGATLWLAFAGRTSGRSAQRAHQLVEFWWVGQVVSAARRSIGLRFEITNDGPLSPGPIIAVGRHASYADALLPAMMFGTGERLELRYVLAAGLAWLPSIDVFGNRLHNRFVARDGEAPGPALEAIAELAADLGPGQVAVIFPEGRFFTPQRKARAVARLAETDPQAARRADRLVHLLPPRPGGTLALLRSAPTADVVVIAHDGLERFTNIRDIMRHAPLDAPVRVQTWRRPRAGVPDDEAGQIVWLYDQWEQIDRWIDARAGEDGESAVRGRR